MIPAHTGDECDARTTGGETRAGDRSKPFANLADLLAKSKDRDEQ